MQTQTFPDYFPVTLTPRGTLTIPKKLREKAKIKNSATLLASFRNGKILLQPAIGYSYPIRIYTDAEIDQFIADDKLDPKLAEKFDKKFGFKPFSPPK